MLLERLRKIHGSSDYIAAAILHLDKLDEIRLFYDEYTAYIRHWRLEAGIKCGMNLEDVVRNNIRWGLKAATMTAREKWAKALPWLGPTTENKPKTVDMLQPRRK